MKPTLEPVKLLVAAAFVGAATMASTAFAATSEIVPLFISASHSFQQSFVRVINHSEQSGTVTVTAIDDVGRTAETSFELAPWETRHFNSDDLEDGNSALGITAIGAGTGDWRLAVESVLPLEVLAYVRTADGFLTSMDDRARQPGLRHLVPTFNPATAVNRVSKLRVVNTADAPATVDIVGVDDRGMESEEVRIAVAANAAVTLTSQELEAGPPGSANGLGDGRGKWQLYVEADQRIIVQSLMETVSGHLTNLSTSVSDADYGPPSAAVVGGAAADFPLEHGMSGSILFPVPTGITYANDMFYVLDYFHNEVFTYTAQGARHATGDFNVVQYTDSITYGDGRLYVLVGLNEKVLAYTTDGRRTPVVGYDFDIGGDVGSAAQGIAYSHGRVYIAFDSLVDTDRVEVYSDGEHVEGEEFDLTLGREPIDIVAGPDDLLYVLGDGAVFAYTKSGQPESRAHFDLTSGNGDPVAIAYANGRFYIADDDAAKVFAYTTGGQRAVARGEVPEE